MTKCDENVTSHHFVTVPPAQEWTNRTLAGAIPYFLVLPGSVLSITEITEYTYFSLLRWGWVFLERTRILSGIQFTTHFIHFLVAETKRFVSSTVNVIWTRQTCGQRSSKTAERKRRALENHFSERICYMFLISKCRGD